MNKYRLEQAALDFANKNYDKAREQLEITTSYFKEEGFVEDGIRSEIFLCLSMIKTGEKKKAEEIIRDFVNRISDPDRNIPSLSVLNDLKNELKSFASIKEFKNYFSELFELLDDYQTLTQKSRRRFARKPRLCHLHPPASRSKHSGKPRSQSEIAC
jgi:hypothetical protein